MKWVRRRATENFSDFHFLKRSKMNFHKVGKRAKSKSKTAAPYSAARYRAAKYGKPPSGTAPEVWQATARRHVVPRGEV
uniref:Uncharacterized protein n=1 Tax=Romanomermis culicivorax TaxID=13658 RepID=A0A915IQN6_ROMCU